MPVLSSYSENKETKTEVTPRKIINKIDILNKKVDSLYRDIYVSRSDNLQNLNNIIDDLDDAIDRLQSTNMNDVSGMSQLLMRLDQDNENNVMKLRKNVEELFNDQNLISSLFANEDIHKYIAAENYQYDMICKYLPKLQDALDILADNTLCADNFSKSFLNPKSSKSSKQQITKFSNNSKKLEKEYDISTFLEKTYNNTSKYGEDFIYVVPYTLAFQRLLRRANYNRNNSRIGQVSFYESNTAKKDIVTECVENKYIDSKEYKTYMESVQKYIKKDEVKEFDTKFEGFAVNLHFNESNVVLDSVNEMVIMKDKSDVEKIQSLSTMYESAQNKKTKMSSMFTDIKVKNDKLSLASHDGLIINGELDRDPEKVDDINGAVLERLPRENVIPIYIGKKCLGYYYFQFKEDKNACGYCGGTHSSAPGISNAANYQYDISKDQQEIAVRFIASKISSAIDTKFINANKDLKEEIYSILQYNEKFDLTRSNDISVTFLPAEDVIHCYFELNEETHRGISDLHNSVIPAMLYILLYLTDIIGKITRSTDKRIYYVKQNVETNVARTMMNVVQQIKKGNMGMRQIESMNNILNIVGKYNDYIIPLGQSGDAPIQFEVMQGQDIQTPTDIMEKMEEAAVNSTGVPLELVNSTMQQDFAIRFSMSNTRFLKRIYTRQRKTQKFFSKIYTKVYNYEFQESNDLIEIILPPPTYLTMNNNQQLIDNISQLADKIIETELYDEEDEVKNEFKKIYIRNHLLAYIDYEAVERYVETAKVNIATKKDPQVSDGGNDSDNMDDF